MKLIPNAGTVATTASSMWAVYGAFLLAAGIPTLEYIQNNRGLRWQDMVVPIAIIVIGAARLTFQTSVATATERKLEQERLTRVALEVEATSPGPAITQDQVKAIKQEAAAAVAED